MSSWLGKGEEGYGLLMVVVALALLGALALGASGAARREFRNATDVGYAAAALQAAEAGLAAVADAGTQLAGVPPLVPVPGPSWEGGGVRYTTTELRLGGGLALLTSVGERVDAGGGLLARRVLAELGRLAEPTDSGAPRFRRLREHAWVQVYR